MNQIKMPNGNVLSFNSDGNLCMIVMKCKNKEITRNIEYDGQYRTKVKK